MKPNEAVVSNWSTLIDDFNTSGQEYFTSIEAKVAQRQVPNVTVSRIDFHERGAFSDKRQYLRFQRDDLIFDVGAAPYGTGFFFSWWMVRSRAKYPWLYPVGFFVAVLMATSFLGDGGVFFAIPGALVIVSAMFILLGKGSVLGPESHVAAAPLVGWIFRIFANDNTYHAMDLIAMYQESIRRCVNESVDEALKQQGLKALTPEQSAIQPQS